MRGLRGLFIGEQQKSTLHPDARAMEEWKQLQSIIGRLETLEFQVRGWLLVLLGGLVAALLNGNKLKPPIFALVSIPALFAFCGMELVFRRSKRAAIRRGEDRREPASRQHELRWPADLRRNDRWRRLALWNLRYLWKEARMVQVWSFYSASLLILRVSLLLVRAKGGRLC